MTLQAELLCGSSTPTRSKYPVGDFDFALADDVLSWLDSIGMTLFDWQRSVLRHALAIDERGKWAAYEVDLIVPRQNGKNEILVALELASVHVLRKRLVVHSAHEAATAAKQMARIDELADQLPEVARLLPLTKTRGMHVANGKEHIRFRNGAVLDLKTRTRKAGRGFSADLVVLDEAFELSAQAVGSLMYTLRARRNPQMWKTSSAPHANSNILHADRERAEHPDVDDSRFLYMEWGNDADCDPNSPQSWARSNPSLGMVAPGFALELQTFRNEWAGAKGDPETAAEFIREVCGVPEMPAGAGSSPIPLDVWESLTDGNSMATDASIRLALDVGRDRKFSTFAVAGHRADALGHVAVRDRRPGTDWVLARGAELAAGHKTPVIIVKGSPAASFIDEFERAGVAVDVMSPGEYAEACGRFIDATRGEAPQLRHRGDTALRAALAAVAVKDVGDGAVAWGRKSSSTDITALTACTVAWGRVGDGAAPEFFVY
jgi:hypothetical protein